MHMKCLYRDGPSGCSPSGNARIDGDRSGITGGGRTGKVVERVSVDVDWGVLREGMLAEEVEGRDGRILIFFAFIGEEAGRKG